MSDMRSNAIAERDAERRARIEETREKETTVDSSQRGEVFGVPGSKRDDYDAQIPDLKVFVPDENQIDADYTFDTAAPEFPKDYFYSDLISGNREGSTYQQQLTLRYSENELASDEMKVQVYSKLKGMSDRRYLLLRELQPGEELPWQESWEEAANA